MAKNKGKGEGKPIMTTAVIFDIDNTLYNYDLANKKALEELSAYTVKHFGWEPEIGRAHV